MKYRNFGQTDLEVSVICFGPMRFAAKEPGSDDKSQAGQHALEHAIERGVNFIHSSYEYGTRWAMGNVLKDHPKRHDLHHIIKVPVPDFKDGGKFSAEKFRLRVEEALRDLHTERIAVLQHLQRHDPNTDAMRTPDIPHVHEEMLEVFSKLKDEGKVGYLTTFPYTPGFAEAVIDAEQNGRQLFDGMVAYYNPVEMEMGQFFESMQARGQGFFCIRPFMAGLLTDRRINRAALPAGDRMQASQWDAAYERLAQFQSALNKDIDSWTAYTIQFCLSHPIVTSLIVGLNTVAQVDEVLDAADGEYPDLADFETALALYQQHGLVTS